MKNQNIQEEPKVNFCNGLLLESMHIFTVNYHVLGNPLLSNVQWSNCYPEKLCVLNCVFISSVNGGISSLGIKKVDMLNRSKNILYLSLNVDRRYCKNQKFLTGLFTFSTMQIAREKLAGISKHFFSTLEIKGFFAKFPSEIC